MKTIKLLLQLILIVSLFAKCGDDTIDEMEMNNNLCGNQEAQLDMNIGSSISAQYVENSQFVAAFHTILSVDTSITTNAIQVIWKDVDDNTYKVALLVEDDIWEVGSYTYDDVINPVSSANSFIINTPVSEEGPQLVGKNYTLTIDEVDVEAFSAASPMQRDYLYLKGSFTGQFMKLDLSTITISAQFEICNQ